MEIIKIGDNKKVSGAPFAAERKENMIYRYLDNGYMFALYDDGIKDERVVTKERDTIYELKNIAAVPKVAKVMERQ